jgi:hypothetical protein
MCGVRSTTTGAASPKKAILVAEAQALDIVVLTVLKPCPLTGRTYPQCSVWRSQKEERLFLVLRLIHLTSRGVT